MRGAVETMVFTGLAVAVHAAVIVSVSQTPGTPESAGSGGAAVLSLAAMPAQMEQTVQAWEQIPQAETASPELPEIASQVETAQPPAETTPFAPNAITPVSTPHPAASAPPILPDQPSEPPHLSSESAALAPPPVLPDTPVTAPPKAVAEAPRPMARPLAETAPPDVVPDNLADAPAPPSAPQVAQTAAGAGAGAQTGRTSQSNAATIDRAQRANAMAVWGAKIRSRIESRKRKPSGRWEPGRTILRITVSSGGQLQSVGIVASSGNPVLDDAAIAAVRRAGRLPKAPPEVGGSAQQFDLPIAFTR